MGSLMKNAVRLLQPLIVVALSLLLLIAAMYPKLDMTGTDKGGSTETDYTAVAKAKPASGVEISPDQSFSGGLESTIDYNIYVQNEGSTTTEYTLTVSSNQGYPVEVWLDTDWLNGGDFQLIPPQGASVTLGAGEVATLIVRVTTPSRAIDGTVDVTTIRADSTESDASDSVTVVSTINSNLRYPSDWIQLGSDPLGDPPPPPTRPGRVDINSVYYTNNGTHVFIRMAEADTPTPKSFEYIIYMDTEAGGQQIGSYYYDYFLSSDGTLYAWDGTGWVDSGYTTYMQIDGTSIVLWADLDNLGLDTQDIQLLAWTATKDMIMKDEVGPYTISRENIPEIPLVMIPLVTLAVYLAVYGRRKKRDRRSNERKMIR